MTDIDKLLSRRSVKVKHLIDPGPNEQQIRQILTAAMRVPDHGKLAPWRFTVFDKTAQADFGEVCAKRFAELHSDANHKQIAFERDRPQRAPLLIAMSYLPVMGKIPEWEQQLSAGAAGMNLLHAAHALGFAGQWLTEWIAFDEVIREALCSDKSGKIAGFFYIGTPEEAPEERQRPDYDEVVSNWPLARV